MRRTRLRHRLATLSSIVVLLAILATPSAVGGLGLASAMAVPIAVPFESGIHSLTTGLTLAPASGVVGTRVSASGTGFGVNSTIGFTFAGIPVASTCSTDSTGSFPGTSGTACSFKVPSAPGRVQSVVASEAGTNTVVGTTAIGVQPYAYAAVYDAGMGEVFVANYGSNNVSVISDSTNTVVATVPVGTNPYAIAYDSGTGEVFVGNQGSSNVSVISDSTNTVIATIPVGQTIYDMAYDSGTGEVFVANYHSDNVSVISDATNTVVASVEVGTGPVAVGYDAGAGEVFIANFNTDNVSVISDVTNTLVATIAVGGGPYWATYDSGAREMFIPNIYSSNVSVISDTTNTIVATVAVGSGPGIAAYDSGAGEVFVGNGGSNNVSVISDTTNTVVSTIGVGTGPNAIAYDSTPGVSEVFVANQGSNNVSVISDPTNSVIASIGVQSSPVAVIYDPGTDSVFVADQGANNVTEIAVTAGIQATASFTLNATLSLSPTRGAVGSVATALGIRFLPNSTITIMFAGASVPSTCSTDSNGSFPGTTGTPCTFTVPSALVGPTTVSASDGTNTAVASFYVSPSLTLSSNSGVVGTALSASGTGFAANSSIGFTFAGMAVASTCSTDSTGSFPGTSGTACSFKVPSAPGGIESVVASEAGTNTVVASVAVGTQPYPYTSAYDSGTGEVFVANYGSNNVSVISDSTNTVVATVPVGTNPYAIAYRFRDGGGVRREPGIEQR